VSCYHPIKGYRTSSGVVFSELSRYDILGDIEIPCGMCIGCRLRRAQDWTLRIMHEASIWPENSFVTLTYGRNCLPADGSLDHRDFQLFMKRLRKWHGDTVRFYMCGEYGEKKHRPHYHACLFNVGFRSDRVPHRRGESGFMSYLQPDLTKLWPHGEATVQNLVKENAGYCARYIMKKRLGVEADAAYVTADGVIQRPEYAAMSLRPGIGAYWFKQFGRDVYPHDFVIAGGSKFAPPKYYDKLMRRNESVDVDGVEYARFKRALLSADEQTEERRAVREKVQLARITNLKRELE
jgi:hypothetical protein